MVLTWGLLRDKAIHLLWVYNVMDTHILCPHHRQDAEHYRHCMQHSKYQSAVLCLQVLTKQWLLRLLPPPGALTNGSWPLHGQPVSSTAWVAVHLVTRLCGFPLTRAYKWVFINASFLCSYATWLSFPTNRAFKCPIRPLPPPNPALCICVHGGRVACAMTCIKGRGKSSEVGSLLPQCGS